MKAKYLILFLISANALACGRGLLLKDMQDRLAKNPIDHTMKLNCLEAKSCVCVDGWTDGDIDNFGALNGNTLIIDKDKKAAIDAKMADVKSKADAYANTITALKAKLLDGSATDADKSAAIKMLLDKM